MSQPELLFARSLARSLGCLGAGCLLAWLVAFACLLACWLDLAWLGLAWLGLACLLACLAAWALVACFACLVGCLDGG